MIIRDPVGADRQRISPAVQQVDGFQTSSGSGQQQIVTASADIAVQTRPVMAGAASTENVHISSLKEGGTSSSAPVSEVQSVSKDGLGVSLQHQVQSSALVEGSFTDPESDEDPVHTFNSFGVLENIQDGMDGELPKVSLSRSPPATSSPRKTKSIRHSRRNSAGNLKECDITLQQLKDLKGVLNRRVQATGLVDEECPRSAVIDEKDVELLNRLVKRKVGRPSKASKKKTSVPDAPAKYSLRSHDKSNSFCCVEYSGCFSTGFTSTS